jgi:replication factor C subunit 2/4
MEAHSRVTRFCFICNYVSRLIDPIVSRCAKFRFKPLGSDAMLSRLSFIADSERVSLAPHTLQTLSDVSLGDMRKAVTLLQSAAALYGARGEVAVTPEHVRDVAGIIPENAVHSLLAACRAGAGAFDAAQAAVEALVKEGYPALQVLAQLTDALIADDGVSDAAKATVAARAAAADKRLADGADEGLQLLDVAAAAQRALAGLSPAGGATLTAGS